MMSASRTLRKAVDIEGFGVHSGKPVRLRMRPSGEGKIVFRRTDLGGAELIPAPELAETPSSTVLQGGHFRIGTVEHLLASLWAAGVGSCLIELDAEEVPVLDGSALPFVRALETAGTEELAMPRTARRIAEGFTVSDGDAWVKFEPSAGDGPESLTLSYTIVYDHPKIGRQSREVDLTWPEFAREIAPARTFGFLKDVERLRRLGLALGSSYGNTVVLSEADVVNPPLRFPDEFVRHKLLDLAGDLALLGRPLIGRVSAHKAGHRLHLEALRRLIRWGTH
ncbi:MAG: UDP-3-O-[3-hydroxymyristoyl] N-acetylglucosamine deacetylase [Candidatus Aminicenantes bacterium]|nr:UDP-3-O-[3-hydroxymyristoyl] N-acetylglucosamine deacetylase [Candidatus Aminicenantes bacterium]